jgi:hypothetical protein
MLPATATLAGMGCLMTIGYFFATVFIGSAALILSLNRFADLSITVMVVVVAGIGALFLIPWGFDTSNGPGLTNDDRYQKTLNEAAYSCQPEHYDQQNCRAQKQGLDAAARWYNEQRLQH